jgi:hypothetical protein
VPKLFVVAIETLENRDRTTKGAKKGRPQRLNADLRDYTILAVSAQTTIQYARSAQNGEALIDHSCTFCTILITCSSSEVAG